MGVGFWRGANLNERSKLSKPFGSACGERKYCVLVQHRCWGPGAGRRQGGILGCQGDDAAGPAGLAVQQEVNVGSAEPKRAERSVSSIPGLGAVDNLYSTIHREERQNHKQIAHFKASNCSTSCTEAQTDQVVSPLHFLSQVCPSTKGLIEESQVASACRSLCIRLHSPWERLHGDLDNWG